MQDYKVVFTGQDNLSPQVKKIKNEVNGLTESAQKIDKIEQKFNKITNSTAPLQRKLKDLQTIMANMKYDGLDKTDTFKKVTAEAQRLKQALQGAKEEIDGIKNKGGQLEGIFGKIKIGGGGGISSAIGSIGSMAAVATAAGAAIGVVGSKIADLANEGIELAMQAEGIKYRFEQIGGTAVYLEELRTHTHGLVNDLDLMKATVKAKDFNIPMKDLGTYLEFAQLKAQQTGESVDYLVDSIVTGLGRQSVQILDNLGISAAELKSKMAQGKSMTEAVAEVINTQLTQAGEHFETEAERAQRKLIELQNEQMRVGENLAPLKTDWQNFCTSIEIWAMKAVQALGALFSEAQRIKNLQQDMYGGGSGKPSRADREVEYFKKIGTEDSKQNYQKNVETKYNKEINKLSGEIQKVKDQIARERKNGADVHSTLDLTTQLKQLVNQRTAARAERDKALKGMKAVMNPKTNNTKTDIDPITPKGGGKITRSTTPKVEKVEAKEGSLKYLDEQIAKKRLEFGLAINNESRRTIQKEIDDLVSQRKTLEIQAKFDLGAVNKGGSNLSEYIKNNIIDPKKTFGDYEKEGVKLMDKAVTSINERQLQDWKKGQDKIKDFQETAANAMKSAVKNSTVVFEAPEFDIMGTVAQAVANVALGYGKAVAAKDTTASGWAWLAFAAVGLAEMLSVIASIKSATAGFANGGIVGGSSFSGDKLLARVNSGEMILPAKKASELGDVLSTNASENYLTIDWKLKGSDLYGSLHNFSKVKAKSGKITGIK